VGTSGHPGAPVAAVDCGTNSTRLLVTAADGTPLVREMRITRLGEGVDATGALAPAAIERTVTVLRDYRRMMDDTGVGAARMVATSAARDAANGGDFLAAATEAVGVPCELLSGDEEGRLSFTGATASLPPGLAAAERLLVVDIGGGSTELVVGRPADPASARARSVDMGCVRASERYLLHDPPTAAELADAGAGVRALLDAALGELPEVPHGGTVVGLAGTVSTLAALEFGVREYRREALHHRVLPRAAVHAWRERLAGEDAAARLRRPGMVAGRADVIVGGVLVLDCVMDLCDLADCLVSEDDILDGMAAGLRRPPAP